MRIEALEMTPVTMRAESHLGELVKPEEEKVPTFGEYLAGAIKKVNELQHTSEAWDAALAAGRVEDISQVVIAGQKAEIATQLALQVRNRAVSAYQEIMRMQV